MRVLVTGATGFIGRASVGALLRAGHDVRVLARDAARAGAAFGDIGRVDVVVGEAIDRPTVLRALEGCEGLVQAAATYSYDRRDAKRMVVENPAIARAVLGAALQAITPHVVDVSTAGVFSTDVERVDEATPLTRAGDRVWADLYIQSKVLAELAGRELETAGLARVTVHPTMVVGPEDRGPGVSGTVLIRLLRNRLFPRSQLGWVDVRDVADAVVAALDARPGSAYILCRGVEPLQTTAARLDRLTGRRRFRRFVPPGLVRAMAGVNERLGAPLRSMPSAANLESLIGGPPVIDGARAVRDLGIAYRDLDTTLDDALRWWAANGVLDAEREAPA